MPDFDLIESLLDQAGGNLERVQELSDRLWAEIEESPPEDQNRLRARFLELCQRRAVMARQQLDAALESAKFKFK